MRTHSQTFALGFLQLILPVLLLMGIMTFAGPCGMHDDGSVSSCFWASRSLMGLAIALVLIALGRLGLSQSRELRRGLNLATVVLGILVLVTPGGLIDLCMMQTMRCHTIMRPFALVTGVLVSIVAIVDFFLVKPTRTDS